MLSSLSRRLLCVCLLFGLLLGISLPSYADEIDRQALLDGQVISFDEGLDLFINNELILPSSSFGSIQDDTGASAFDVTFYSVPFNWSTEEIFLPSASIGYTKLFTNANLFSQFEDVNCKSWDILRNNVLPNYFDKLWGYTITLVRDDVDYIAKGTKIDLDLVLSDKGQADNNLVGNVTWNTSTGEAYQQKNLNRVISNDSLSDFVWQDISAGCSYFTNKITVYGYDYDTNEVITLGSVSDVSGISQSFKAPANISNIVIDVCYSIYDVYGSSGYPQVNIPLMYTANLSGTIALDESGIISGLINGIVDWLKSILNAIKELPIEIANKFKDVLVGLFVPTPEGLSAQFDVLKTTAEQKLGFVYTIFNMVYNLFDSLLTGVISPTNTITIPRFAFSFDYIEGGEIVLWEEMTFDIMPAGLSDFQDLIKTVTSIMLVTATMTHCVEYFRGFFRKE